MEKQFSDETGLRLRGHRGVDLHYAPVLKVIDERIRAKERGDDETYIWIDIFPIDGLPRNEKLSRKLCNSLNRRRLLFVAISTPASSAKTMKRKMVKALLRPIGLFLSIERLSRDIYNRATQYDFEDAAFVSPITWNHRPYEGRVSKCCFDALSSISFEGRDYLCVSETDRHLSGMYGDYMKLPSEENRGAHSVVCWIEEQTV